MFSQDVSFHFSTLLDVHKQVLQQRDDYYVESETLRRSATPRPEWEKCIDYIPGGEMRWQELSEGKTSDQLVDILLQELGGGGAADAGGAEYFDGQVYCCSYNYFFIRKMSHCSLFSHPRQEILLTNILKQLAYIHLASFVLVPWFGFLSSEQLICMEILFSCETFVNKKRM